MQAVSDDVLLNLAGMSAALIGLFLVGVFFFIQSGFDKVEQGRLDIERYFRSGTRILLVLYAIAIFVPLALVLLDLGWARALFLILSVALVATNVDSINRIRPIWRVPDMRSLVINEVLGTVAVVLIVALPWILGGTTPSREDLTWAILLAFVVGFISFGAHVLWAFDLVRSD